MSEDRGLPRGVEVCLALFALFLSSPVLIIVAIAVKLGSRGPVFFRQTRVGRGGVVFEMIKFRSMRVGAEGPQVTGAGDPRVTAVGRLLRTSKLDELPELWNVVRGEMSLVGPRPEVPRFVDLSAPIWQRVLSVRPGITDPVTLELRDEESLLAACDDPETVYREELLPQKLTGSADYLERRTAFSDLAVLAATLVRIVMPASSSRFETGAKG